MSQDRRADKRDRATELGRLARLCQKELREILRDRRTILTLVLMPLLLYPLLTIAFRQLLVHQIRGDEGPLYRIGFASANEAQWVLDYLGWSEEVLRATQSSRPAANPDGPPMVLAYLTDDLEGSLRSYRIDLAVRVRGKEAGLAAPSPARDLAVDLEILGLEGSHSSREAREYFEDGLRKANRRFLARRLGELDVSQRPIPVEAAKVEVKGDQPALQLSLVAVLPLILILMTITGAVYPAIDLTAGERERGTLEILIAAPVPRLSLLLAKYTAVVTVALLTAVVNLATMTLTVQVSGLAPLFVGGEGLTFSAVAKILFLLCLFGAFFSAVLLALTSFARSFKEAQSYLIPLMLASLAPGMLGLVPELKLSLPLQLVPLANVVLLSRDLFTGESRPLAEAVVVLSTLAYSLAAMALAARVFGAESTLYGVSVGWSDLWRRPRRTSQAPTVASALLCLALAFPGLFLLTGVLSRSAGSPIFDRLLWGSVGTALLFGALPLLLAWMRRIDLLRCFKLRAPNPVAIAASLVLGLSLWPLAAEIVVLEREFGVVSLGGDPAERAKLLAAQLRTLPVLLVVLGIAAAPAVFEEWFFRGYLQSALLGVLSPPRAILASASLFGLFHLVSGDMIAVERFFPSAFMGLALGWVCWRTGSLWASMLVHLAHNGFLILVVYFEREIAALGLAIEPAAHVPARLLLGGGAAAALSLVVLGRFGRRRG